MKTPITLEIEERLKAKAKRECKRYAFEVDVPRGVCDFVTTKMNFDNYSMPYVICYEIKVSFSDYQYSENGANFVGDENYYVMPAELLEEIIEKQAQGKFQLVGVITYKNGRFYKKSDGKWNYKQKLSFEERMRLMDTMLMRALYDKE